MRVLFAVSPGLDHLYPAMGLAWALRAAGHELVVASSGVTIPAAVNAGLTAREVADPGADFDAIFPQVGTVDERAKRMRDRGRAMAKSGITPEIILEKFGKVSDLMAAGTLEFARQWRPDLVVYSRLQGAALLTARALGIPAVEHGFSFLREGTIPQRFLPHLTPTYKRLGVPVELPEVTQVYFAPDFMMFGEGTGWTIRSVPFQGGAVLPDWMVAPRRPRICVTLGTTVPHVAGVSSLGHLLGVVDGMDAEIVLALGDNPDLAPLGTLPDNVRVVGWTPISALLAYSDGIIHHGGANTTLAAAHAAVPQLVLPHGADNWINAEMVERCGIGLTRQPGEVDRQVLDALVGDDGLRKSASALTEQLAAQPTPSEIVPRLVELAARVRV
nr:nucleotide disphospho-sugar-binding domain-containing protein [Kibdelosporangium sp. MJ126-NF4]CEL20578.1 Glycosyltransferase [Kibdelosporangium sp. MJ126-NF4]CTQ89489.1 Glycosyltransferase [Kibdelosporangium sp. MJ126-NF4]